MKTQGRLTGIQVPFRSEKAVISFEVTADPADVERYKDKELDITIVRHSKKARTGSQCNALGVPRRDCCGGKDRQLVGISLHA